MNELIFKGIFAGLGTILTYYLDKFSTLVWLLIIFEISDYITGILAAYKNKGLSSGDALWGFIKKLCYFFLVGVAFGTDYVVMEACNMLGIEFNYPPIFGVLSVCYLLSTEAISILENIEEFGITIPFLSKALKKLRNNILEKSGFEEE